MSHLLNLFSPVAATTFVAGLRAAWPIVQETLRTIPQVYWAKRYASEIYGGSGNSYPASGQSLSRSNLRFFYPDWRSVAQQRKRGYRSLRQYGKRWKRYGRFYRKQYNFYHRRWLNLARGHRGGFGGWQRGT